MTIKLGVVALAGPDNGGTYQYTLSMLQALQHTSGFQITLYGDPTNPDFAGLGYPICPFAESRVQQLTALTAHKAQSVCLTRLLPRNSAGADLFVGAAAYFEAVCLYAARSPGELFPAEFFVVATDLAISGAFAAAGTGAAHHLRIQPCQNGHQPFLRYSRRADRGHGGASLAAILRRRIQGAVAGRAKPAAAAGKVLVLSRPVLGPQRIICG